MKVSVIYINNWWHIHVNDVMYGVGYYTYNAAIESKDYKLFKTLFDEKLNNEVLQRAKKD